MRLSRYFLPILKENPADAQIVSHRLMLRAGMIKQSSAGIYSWLPMGFKVLRKIENIVHDRRICGASPGGMMPMVQRCCASKIAMTGRCFMVPPMKS